MDETLVIASAMILAIALVIGALVTMSRQQSRKEQQKLAQQLSEIAERYNLQLTYLEHMQKRLIALDLHKTYLVFIDGHRNRHYILPVSEITKVAVEKKSRKIRNGNKGPAEEHVDSINLLIHIKNADTVSLPFYEEILDGLMALLPQQEKAKKWKTLLNI